MDFEQLAFIEKWRRRAVRGVVVGLDATRGDTILTLRVADLGPPIDLSGRDETGAVRKQRLTIGGKTWGYRPFLRYTATHALVRIPEAGYSYGRGWIEFGVGCHTCAMRLVVEPDTIKDHVQSIIKKLGATDRTHAAVIAVRGGTQANTAELTA